MANGIRTGDLRGFNKGCSSKFHDGSRVRHTPEEGRRTYRPKRYRNNNKDEDNSPNTLNDKNVTEILTKKKKTTTIKTMLLKVENLVMLTIKRMKQIMALHF